MSLKSLGVDVAEAQQICDSLKNVHWPSTDVVWLKLDDDDVRTDALVGQVDINELKLFELQNLKTKLLEISQKNFNVCQSLPHSSSSVNVKWPEKNIADVRKLWVSSTDTQTAIVEVINVVRDLWRDDCLVLNSFPLTSDVCFNVLYIIGQLFSMVGMVPPKQTATLLFYGYQKWTLSFETRFENICKSMTDGNQQNKSFSSATNNCCYNTFSKYLAILNCVQLRNEVVDILQNIQAANQIAGMTPNMNLGFEEVSDIAPDQNNNIICHSCKMNGRCLITCKKLINELDDLKSFLNQIVLSNPEDSKDMTLQLDFSADSPLKQMLEIVPKSTKGYSEMDVTQFCLKQLLSAQIKLSGIFQRTLQLTDDDIRKGSCLNLDNNENIVTSLKEYSWAEVPVEVKVLDFGKELWMHIENHGDYQIESLLRICSALEDTWRGESLELRGFPMLSEFNTSIIFLLGHLFDKVRFSFSNLGRNSIFFYSFKSYPRSVRDHLEKVLSDCSLAHHEAVLSLVPLKLIYGGEYYDIVRESNNWTLLKQCDYMIKFLYSKVESAKCM